MVSNNSSSRTLSAVDGTTATSQEPKRELQETRLESYSSKPRLQTVQVAVLDGRGRGMCMGMRPFGVEFHARTHGLGAWPREFGQLDSHVYVNSIFSTGGHLGPTSGVKLAARTLHVVCIWLLARALLSQRLATRWLEKRVMSFGSISKVDKQFLFVSVFRGSLLCIGHFRLCVEPLC